MKNIINEVTGIFTKKSKHAALFTLMTAATIAGSQASYAALDLELTQGISGGIPIAIVPFQGQTANDASSNNLATVISNDLRYSGRFKVMDFAAMEQQPNALSQVNYGYWKKNAIDNLVIGKALSHGSQYQVDYSLLDIFKGADGSALSTEEFKTDQANLRRLAHHISDQIYKQLTGDKGVFSTHIVYVLVERAKNKPARYSLVVADVDGYNPKTIVVSSEPMMSPAWSPDGKRVAYVSFEQNHAAIYVVNVQNGARQLVTNFPGINGAPAWAPDGQRLAVVLSKDGHPNIYVANLQSKGLQQITQGSSIDTEPNWAPDGKSIIFTSDRGGSPQIYRTSLSNPGVAERLTFNGKYNARASFSADGKSIVMLHQSPEGYSIAMQDLQNKGFTILTKSGLDTSPSLAPNGKLVLYGTNFSGHGVLGVVSSDGRVKLRLPAREGDVLGPAWGPF
ncbi:Tol-Pal system beta propeller repeat protein TolB [soil metagenome]